MLVSLLCLAIVGLLVSLLSVGLLASLVVHTRRLEDLSDKIREAIGEAVEVPDDWWIERRGPRYGDWNPEDRIEVPPVVEVAEVCEICGDPLRDDDACPSALCERREDPDDDVYL